jgi:hypothetical protein
MTMALKIVTKLADAAYMIEVIYDRELDLLGLSEVETDMTSLLVASKPSMSELEALVPNGWELVEVRIITAADWETDEDNEDDWLDSDDQWDYADDFESEMENA